MKTLRWTAGVGPRGEDEVATITFGEAEIEISGAGDGPTAAQVDELIALLAELRPRLLPEITWDYPDRVKGEDHLRHLYLRHAAFGWLHFSFSHEVARELAAVYLAPPSLCGAWPLASGVGN